MAYDSRKNGLRRQEAVGMDRLVNQFIRNMKLASGLRKLRVEEAWKAVSGAERYTLDVTFHNDVLTCTLSSSVVRNQLYFQRSLLVEALNEYLKNDDLFARDDGHKIVKTLILK